MSNLDINCENKFRRQRPKIAGRYGRHSAVILNPAQLNSFGVTNDESCNKTNNSSTFRDIYISPIQQKFHLRITNMKTANKIIPD